jgi:hypothetical protein
MRNNELELIAALAEGRLEDETLARALIEASEEHRAAYEAQKLAIDALRGAGTVLMDDTERAMLRRDLWTALKAGQRAQGTASPWYYRWTPVAAGLLVVVGLIAVINRGGEDGAARGLFEAAAETTTTAAGDIAMDGASGGEAGPETAGDQDEASSGGDSAAPYDLAYLIDTAQRLRDGDFATARLESFDESSQADVQSCVDDALEGYQVLGVIDEPALAGGDTDTVPEDAAPLIAAVPQGAKPSTAPVAFVALSSCELVYLDE